MSRIEYTQCDMCAAMTDDAYKDKWSKVVRNDYFDDVLLFDICPKCIQRLGEFVNDCILNRGVIDAHV